MNHSRVLRGTAALIGSLANNGTRYCARRVAQGYRQASILENGASAQNKASAAPKRTYLHAAIGLVGTTCPTIRREGV
jgi:hypothetical protein